MQSNQKKINNKLEQKSMKLKVGNQQRKSAKPKALKILVV